MLIYHIVSQVSYIHKQSFTWWCTVGSKSYS